MSYYSVPNVPLVYKFPVVIDNLIVLTIGKMKFKFYKFLLETSKRYQLSYKIFDNFLFLIVRIVSELIYFVFLILINKLPFMVLLNHNLIFRLK